jgi:hypothetical protein
MSGVCTGSAPDSHEGNEKAHGMIPWAYDEAIY